jgi:hypothetical protein
MRAAPRARGNQHRIIDRRISGEKRREVLDSNIFALAENPKARASAISPKW